jgi:4-hydroxythreonine-4-phosphate dehydrogenase
MARKPLAVTQGDPAGIGPEIIVKSFLASPREWANCLVVGQVDVIRRAVRIVGQHHCFDGLQKPPIVELSSIDEVPNIPPGCLGVLDPDPAGEPIELPTFGQVSALAGQMAANAVIWAARAALKGEISAMVTAPLHKEALHAAGVLYAGHTELLQAEAAAFVGCDLEQMPVRMMLANDELRTVLLSIHISMRDAILAVTVSNLLTTLEIAHTSLKRLLGRSPRIGVAGLNPHAGEGGLFGREEIEVIEPAVRMARERGIHVHGPFAPDTVFMRARHTMLKPGEFDVVVAMYHDQGLIPVKYLGVEQGVNITLGLPLVRTSPDHGTAFDIAGTGCADADSLLAALKMARQLSV